MKIGFWCKTSKIFAIVVINDTRIADSCWSQICAILASPAILAIIWKPGFTGHPLFQIGVIIAEIWPMKAKF